LKNKDTSEVFSSQLGLFLSVLGIAVGTGNIWRFPRVVSQNGGGTFLIPWAVFLLLWSIPLIIAEFAIGRYTRTGDIGSFVRLIGEKYAWMGGFIACVASFIMFYYSVVTGWTLYYFQKTLLSDLPTTLEASRALWDGFITSWDPLLFHGIALTLGVSIVYQGVVRGIERANKILVPLLLLILLAAALRAVTLPGAMKGLAYLFTPDLTRLMDSDIWLNALTQNAWDTGAGWGLMMTYAIYTRRDRGVNLHSALVAFGNNSVSLLAGITIFSTVFALLGPQAEGILRESGPASTGLTFLWMPQLFARMPGGAVLAPLFFLGLALAAFSSLISMIELARRVLTDLGFSRGKAAVLVGVTGFVSGIPSAVSLDFLVNQDWVWGVGLMISGAFIAFAVQKFGVERFRTQLVNTPYSRWKIGKWWSKIIKYAIPFQVSALLAWWLYHSTQWYPKTWWRPFSLETPETLGTCLFQWGLAMAVLVSMNKKLSRSGGL